MQAAGERAGGRKYGAIIVLTVVLAGAVSAAAYYQQELLTYWHLQGWNTGAVKQTMEKFIREAHDGQKSAGEMLDPAFAEPVIEGGKLVGVRHSGAHGPEVSRLKPVIPDAAMKDCVVWIKNKSGIFEADVQYPDGQWARFDVSRVNGALRIRAVPDTLSPTQPHPESWD